MGPPGRRRWLWRWHSIGVEAVNTEATRSKHAAVKRSSDAGKERPRSLSDIGPVGARLRRRLWSAGIAGA